MVRRKKNSQLAVERETTLKDLEQKLINGETSDDACTERFINSENIINNLSFCVECDDYSNSIMPTRDEVGMACFWILMQCRDEKTDKTKLHEDLEFAIDLMTPSYCVTWRDASSRAQQILNSGLAWREIQASRSSDSFPVDDLF